MEVAVPMKEVYCATCVLPFFIPYKLIERRGYTVAIFCPSCGKDYRTTIGTPELENMKHELRRVRSEKETLARSNAALRGILKKVPHGR